MTAWWESIGTLEQVFFIVAAPATLIIALQTLLLIFGGGMGAPDSGLDSDVSGIGDDLDIPGGVDFDGSDPAIEHFDADGLRLFSVRGIMAFLTVFGWSGVVLLETGVTPAVSVVIAFLLGAAALFGMALLIRSLMRLQESGNADYRRALGKTARVYLTIPPAGQGQGKINLMLGEALGEFWAVTDGKEPIPTGASVRVVDLAAGVYTVERD
ncbi:MAG: NfeD family protein [Oscillospiraceae bacterium]|jgi:membrane protein implicated in regulation of membrane protease activity|nr:NfeD family protein [Oscillospiraceae bacterium]